MRDVVFRVAASPVVRCTQLSLCTELRSQKSATHDGGRSSKRRHVVDLNGFTCNPAAATAHRPAGSAGAAFTPVDYDGQQASGSGNRPRRSVAHTTENLCGAAQLDIELQRRRLHRPSPQRYRITHHRLCLSASFPERSCDSCRRDRDQRRRRRRALRSAFTELQHETDL